MFTMLFSSRESLGGSMSLRLLHAIAGEHQQCRELLERVEDPSLLYAGFKKWKSRRKLFLWFSRKTDAELLAQYIVDHNLASPARDEAIKEQEHFDYYPSYLDHFDGGYGYDDSYHGSFDDIDDYNRYVDELDSREELEDLSDDLEEYDSWDDDFERIERELDEYLNYLDSLAPPERRKHDRIKEIERWDGYGKRGRRQKRVTLRAHRDCTAMRRGKRYLLPKAPIYALP